MALRKVTFTLDAETVHRIDDAAERLAKPKSQVVREAVADYHSRIGRLSESERLRMLKVFDTLVPLIPARPQPRATEAAHPPRASRGSPVRTASGRSGHRSAPRCPSSRRGPRNHS